MPKKQNCKNENKIISVNIAQDFSYSRLTSVWNWEVDICFNDCNGLVLAACHVPTKLLCHSLSCQDGEKEKMEKPFGGQGKGQFNKTKSKGHTQK